MSNRKLLSQSISLLTCLNVLTKRLNETKADIFIQFETKGCLASNYKIIFVKIRFMICEQKLNRSKFL